MADDRAREHRDLQRRIRDAFGEVPPRPARDGETLSDASETVRAVLGGLSDAEVADYWYQRAIEAEEEMLSVRQEVAACGEQQFAAWFAENYPAGSTINDPAWHAKRIWLHAGRARSEESDSNG